MYNMDELAECSAGAQELAVMYLYNRCLQVEYAGRYAGAGLTPLFFDLRLFIRWLLLPRVGRIPQEADD